MRERIVVVALLLVLLGTGSFLGHRHFTADPNPYINFDGRPYHIRAIHEGIIYWYVPHELVELAQGVFESPRGWQQTGLDFRYTPSPLEADVCFEPHAPTAPQVCRDTSASWLQEGRHLEGDICRITSEFDMAAWRSFSEKERRLVEIFFLNHETGHCLGLDDLVGEKYRTIRIMYNHFDTKEDIVVLWPTSTEIELVKKLITYEDR